MIPELVCVTLYEPMPRGTWWPAWQRWVSRDEMLRLDVPAGWRLDWS